MIDQTILNRLNAATAEERLAALTEVVRETVFPPVDPRMINNHIHTSYSFSPYSPAAAVYAARAEGLCTAGIVDHDSIGGAREFIEAGKIVGIPTTIGIEARVSMAGTPFANLRTNNPDQIGVSYMAMHGVPHRHIEAVQAFFAPLREKRNDRNRQMIGRINELLGLQLDFERDVLPLSLYHAGGSVTERHLMLALAREMIAKGDLPGQLASLGIELSEKQRAQLFAPGNPFFDYDLLGLLKSVFIPKIYIDATDECPTLSQLVSLARDVDAILCYAYLGDVVESVTGDKRAQKFEDDHLDLLFEMLEKEGIRAVTYMPTRNTREQLTRLRGLCARYGMFEISGEDINSPRQNFTIEAMKDPWFSNLIDSTWAVIAHENEAQPRRGQP